MDTLAPVQSIVRLVFLILACFRVVSIIRYSFACFIAMHNTSRQFWRNTRQTNRMHNTPIVSNVSCQDVVHTHNCDFSGHPVSTRTCASACPCKCNAVHIVRCATAQHREGASSVTILAFTQWQNLIKLLLFVYFCHVWEKEEKRYHL